MIPRYGERVQPGRHYILRPGAYAILPRKGRILLTCSLENGPDIQLPGGGIDPGEAPLHALHREVFEETGWRISGAVRLGAFRRFVYMPEYDLWAEKLCTVYVARPIYKLSNPLEPDHFALWKPFESAVSTLGNSGDRKLLQQFLAQSSPLK